MKMFVKSLTASSTKNNQNIPSYVVVSEHNLSVALWLLINPLDDYGTKPRGREGTVNKVCVSVHVW